MTVLRTGIDLIEIERFGAIKPEVRQRFLARVFTPYEQEAFGDSNQSLAGRFAAKEAVAKALGCGIGVVSWQEIEIRRGDSGEPQLVLYGRAAELSESLGLTTWAVSISHSRTMAAASVVASGS